MIKTVADFLEELRDKGLEKIKLEDSDVKHAPGIGDMFEGLTSEILNHAVFEGLDLRIVTKSYIINDSGELSSEMDCMIVIGDGKKLNFSERLKYHVNQVIAVIQVKKTLGAGTIMEAHENLLSSIEINELTNDELYLSRLHEHAYKSLVGKALPNVDNLNNLTDTEEIVYHLLKMQAYYPLRVIISYYGYKSEYSLREGFIKQLKKKLTTGNTNQGLNPVRLPDLIICANNSIVKCAGMPFAAPFFDSEFYWGLYASTHGRPIYYLLEFIWTRLSYMFSISSTIFGDDFEIDMLHPFLLAKDKKYDRDKWSWTYEYNYLSKKKLDESTSTTRPWEPVLLDKHEYKVLHALVKRRQLEVDDGMLKAFGGDKNKLKASLKLLNEKRITYTENEQLKFLLEKPLLVFFQGQAYIGENNSGEMEAWGLKKHSNKVE